MSEINLIANSGIQFYTTKINLGSLSPALKINREFFEKVEIDKDGNKQYSFVFPYYLEKQQRYIELTDEIKKFALNPETGLIDEDKISKDMISKIREDQIVTVRARDAIQSFEGAWIPLPFLRKSYDGKKFQQGPETWARAWFSRIPGTDLEESEFTHTVVLAFDTRCAENKEYYLTPTPRDAQNAIFECASNPNDNFFYCARNWVQDWLKADFDKKREATGKNKQDGEFQWLHISYYLTLLEALNKANAFPKVSLTSHSTSIEVDLILDVGNSRTCGILLESTKAGQAFQFTDAVPLEIRDLTYPNRTYSDPFDMRIAFVKANLGQEAAAIMSGNPQAFAWPSLVRIGHEAQRLSVLSTGDNANSIMSSPKRYLWDDERRDFPWTYISDTKETFAKPALYGIAELFTEDGRLLEKERTKAEDYEEMKKPYPAMNPYFSRSSVMTFALAEIFMHAITYCNSFWFRRNAGNENLPRKLKRIVLTCPTAMLQTEKRILREHAEEALVALKTFFSDTFIDKNLVVIPDPLDIAKSIDKRTEWGYDEATCGQLAFVYSEIKDRFMNNANLYIKTVGKMRADTMYANQPSVTIASVDIGGGTTDLMIATYQSNPDANISVLTPDPKFWEGFNLAGDDILKRAIERIVLPAVKDHADRLGCQNSVHTMNFLFGPYLGETTFRDKLMKKQFANQIAVPIGFGVLQHAAEQRIIENRTFDSFFLEYPRPNAQLMAYINDTFRRAGAQGFDLEKIIWNLDSKGTNNVVKDVVEKMIGDLCGVIAQYHCDYVLLAGRPTMLPVIRDLFLKYLPTTPDRIIQMGHYRMGTWYPFAEGNGVIRDPKTCVSVGAAISLMAGTLSRLGDFTIDTTLLRTKMDSTADYIGEYDRNKAQISEVFLDPDNDNKNIKFYGHMLLGMRQMPIANWIGTPMYKLSFASHDAAKQLKNKLPLTFDLERNPRDKEGLRNIKNVMDREEKKISASDLKLKLQSLADEHGYWLDTGIFLIQLFDNK